MSRFFPPTVRLASAPVGTADVTGVAAPLGRGAASKGGAVARGGLGNVSRGGRKAAATDVALDTVLEHLVALQGHKPSSKAAAE